MRILVFSLGSVFKNTVQGGSQKILRDISIGLAHRGHRVVILCPKRDDNCEIFEFCFNAVVKPILPLRGAFPLPYAVSPFSLTETCRIVEKEISDADLMYCHDGGLNIDFLKNQIPTVISLRDFCYPETLLGALNFKEKAVIVNSMYTYQCLQDTFARVNPRLRNKVKIIYNGYDSEEFRERPITSQFYEQSGLPAKSDKLILGFPHRPEMSKGFMNALYAIKQLSNTWGTRVKLLVPEYMDSEGTSTRTDATYMQIKDMIEDMQLRENVVYHTWVRHERMPEYYAYCDLILCIGNFVESFSNVSVESLLCKTPVIATNTATYRTMPIRQFLNIVPYGDTEQTVVVANKLLKNKNEELLDEARNYIVEKLSVNRMIDEFEKVFRSALEEGSAVKIDKEPEAKNGKEVHYKLAPWCEERNGNIYDDYRCSYFKDPFNGMFCDADVTHTLQELIAQGALKTDIDAAMADGIILIDM